MWRWNLGSALFQDRIQIQGVPNPPRLNHFVGVLNHQPVQTAVNSPDLPQSVLHLKVLCWRKVVKKTRLEKNKCFSFCSFKRGTWNTASESREGVYPAGTFLLRALRVTGILLGVERQVCVDRCASPSVTPSLAGTPEHHGTLQ